MRDTSHRQSKILIIDDEADMVAILRRILEQDGYGEIASTTDPFAALGLFGEFQPDLIVLDLMMPGLSGMQVLAQLRAQIPKETYLPIMVVTALPTMEAGWGALRNGATDFLRKPYDPTELVLRIGNLLETRIFHLQLATRQGDLENANTALHAEVAARERSEAKLRSVTESVGDAIVSACADGNIIFWNRAAEKIFGYRDEEVLGKPLTFIMPERYRERHRAGMARLQSGGEARFIGRTMELAGLRKDGSEFPTELTLSTWKASGGDFYTGVLRDITERQHTASALQQAKEEAEGANRAKSEFLSRVSHELRTPLNVILGFGQLLERDGRDPEEADNIKRVLKAGRHLLELIDDVLDISGIEAGEMDLTIQTFSVSEAIEEALALMRPLAAEREVSLGNLVCDQRVLIDRQRFKQVVLSLLSNAIKYNRRGGRVTLAAEETDGGMLRLAITDNGPGIALADACKVFTAFERLSVPSKGEGIGLGLAISKRLVELMGGRIGVESALGEGSTFWIEVPLEERPVAQLDRNAVPSIPKTLLYVEDDLSNLRLITRILARRPAIQLLSAETGALGLKMAREHRPDLILLDLHLPESNCEQVLARLRTDPRTSAIPVVMLTADDLPGKREQMLTAGARGFLTKPVDVRTFLGVLDSIIEHRP